MALYRRSFTPDRVNVLFENEVFVFGSNLAGLHQGGAARLAFERFGAVWGEGVGLHGQSYAIPTMQGGVETIRPYVDQFIEFAKANNQLTFLVTRIGCGIAGFKDAEIAPLFEAAVELPNVRLPKEFVACLKECAGVLDGSNEVTWRSWGFLSRYKEAMNSVRGGNSSRYGTVRGLRAEEYQNTMAIVRQGFYTTEAGQQVVLPNPKAMVQGTAFYSRPIDANAIPNRTEQTEVIVRNVDCLEEGVRLSQAGYNPAVLNMASHRSPGGGVLNGAGAQEETLFRRTNLFLSLYQFSNALRKQEWYTKQLIPTASTERYPLNQDFGGVYTPNAALFREDENHGYKLMDQPVQLSFIAVPAIRHPRLKDATHLDDQMIEITRNKIRTILRIGLLHGHDALVLGAFGCGAFCNPPSHIASLFREVFEEPEFKNKLRLISFAILDDHNAHRAHNPEGNYLPFVKVFQPKGK